jgi:hypothetical protein
MNARIERQAGRRVDWRLVLGFIVLWIGATGALVAADIAAAPGAEIQGR